MAANIPYLTMNDGRRLPQIGFGLGDVPDDQTAAAVTAGLKAGYRLFDTAEAYRNEASLGQALAESDVERQELCIITKLSKANMGHDAALSSFDKSLERLNLSYVDLYLMHWPVPNLDLYVETWRAFIRLRDEGRALSIGVSNFSAKQLQRLVDETGVVPAVNQIEMQPAYQERDMLALHRSMGIVTQAWGPLGFGVSLTNPEVQRIAAKHGKSPAQAILRWHVQNGVVAIAKTVTPSRMAENLAIFDFELDAGDMAAIAALDDPNGRTGPDPDTFGDPGNTLPPDRTAAGLAARRAAGEALK